MSDSQAPRKRGRPATGKAKTAAQRMAESRLRALEALNASTEPDLSAISTTGLFEALRVAYRQGNPWDMAEVSRELFKRVNERATRPVSVTFKALEPEARGADDGPVIPATVAEKTDGPTVSDKPRGYPTEVKALAVGMADAGKPSREIHAAIMDACGDAPSIKNLARLIRTWRDSLHG